MALGSLQSTKGVSRWSIIIRTESVVKLEEQLGTVNSDDLRASLSFPFNVNVITTILVYFIKSTFHFAVAHQTILFFGLAFSLQVFNL